MNVKFDLFFYIFLFSGSFVGLNLVGVGNKLIYYWDFIYYIQEVFWEWMKKIQYNFQFELIEY